MKTLKRPDGYNGWKNYETWNVALWIQNDPLLYCYALECPDYDDLKTMLSELPIQTFCTPDGVEYSDPKVDVDEINDMLADL